jgi:hypothetical protein
MRRRRDLILGAIVGLLLAGGAWALSSRFAQMSSPGSSRSPAAGSESGMPKSLAQGASVPQVRPIDSQAIRKRAWRKIKPRLAVATRASEDEMERAIDSINDFFSERKQGTKAFAASVLSLKGKWQFIRSHLPYAEANQHLKFLETKFGEHVFKPEELKAAVESAVAEYVKSVQAIENQLLVNCRQDISDSDPLSQKVIPQIGSQKTFQAEFQRLLTVVGSDVSHDLNYTIGREAVVFVGWDIATTIFLRVGAAVATELGVDSTLLAAGAASSWETFGIGLAAMIVVDIAVDWLEKLTGHDPAAAVALKVDGTLDRVRSLLIDGDPEAIRIYRKLRRMENEDTDPTVRNRCRTAADKIERSGRLGLRAELKRLHEMRSRLREETLERLVLEGDGT